MQVNNPSWFELKYPTTNSRVFHVYSSINGKNVNQYSRINRVFEKPQSFIWHDSHLRPLTPKLLNWLKEFVNIFDTNDMLWFASVGTADPKFRPYLIQFYKEHKACNDNIV